MTKYQPDPEHLTAQVQSTINSHPHPLLFASICGSKLYGFDTPNSDRDIHGAHIIPTDTVLGFEQPNPTIIRKLPGNVEISTHEVHKLFTLLLNRNANVLEDTLSPLVAATTPYHPELQAIARTCITASHAKHYDSMAHQALGLMARTDTPNVKHALHMYRSLLTGIHLMQTGHLELHLPTLNDHFRLDEVTSLVAQRQDPSTPNCLTTAETLRHNQLALTLITDLQAAAEASNLPRQPGGRTALQDLLLRIRKEQPQHPSSPQP